MVIVKLENVGLRYGVGPEVLRDVSLTLEEGAFHFLTGPSGAGKSSLLKLMYLAHRPTRGLISLFGSDIATTERDTLPALRRQVGVVFRNFACWIICRHLIMSPYRCGLPMYMKKIFASM